LATDGGAARGRVDVFDVPPAAGRPVPGLGAGASRRAAGLEAIRFTGASAVIFAVIFAVVFAVAFGAVLAAGFTIAFGAVLEAGFADPLETGLAAGLTGALAADLGGVRAPAGGRAGALTVDPALLFDCTFAERPVVAISECSPPGAASPAASGAGLITE